MTKQFAKRSIAAALTTAALAFAAASPVRAADQSADWFQQQQSLTDGRGSEIHRDAAPPRLDKGARSRVGEPATSPEGEACSNQERQLRDAFFSSDGTPYAGAEGQPRC